MKKSICILLAAVMLLGLCACGAKPAEEEKEWTRKGYFTDGDDNMLYVLESQDPDQPGWTVGVIFGEDMHGWIIPQEGNTLHGNLNAWDESAEPFVVTVSEEGTDGLLIEIEGGESYHFTPMNVPDATIHVSVNTEGFGCIGYEEGETAPEPDPDFPAQSVLLNLAEPATYTLAAWPKTGNLFVKWTKNGEDLSTEPQITVLLDADADYIAVFEEDPDWQNPVMNFVGDYQCDRAVAKVECFGYDEALITINWGGSAWETAEWLIIGKLDTETLTISYEGAGKSILTYGEDGEIANQEDVYGDGTGTITFNANGTFTWHEDQSEYGTDMVFAPAWVD